MGWPVVLVDSGGLPVTEAAHGVASPVTVSTNGFGIAATLVASGGMPVVGASSPEPSGSDTDWPSAANRPTFSAGTLSWSGPLGGGVDDGSPVAQTQALTTRATELTTTSNGQIIEGLDMSARVNVRHNDVIIRQCRFTNPDFYSVYVDQGSPTGVIVEDCLFEGPDLAQRTAISPEAAGTGMIVRRCNILGYENGVFLASGMSVLDCWIHDLANDVTAHTDGIQGTGNVTNVLIEGNAIYSRDTSCVIVQNEAGGFSNVTINGNLLDLTADGAAPVICRADKSVGAVTDIVVTNNISRRGANSGYEDFTAVDGAELTYSGNFDDLKAVFPAGQSPTVVQIPNEATLAAAFTPSSALSGSDSNSNLSIRMVITLDQAIAGDFRVAIQAVSGQPLVAAHVAVGVSNGSGNTVATPVEALFGSVAGLNITGGQLALSDPVNLGALAGGSAIVVIIDYTSGSQSLGTGNSNVTAFFKAGTTYDQSAPGSLTASSGNNFGVYGVFQ